MEDASDAFIDFDNPRSPASSLSWYRSSDLFPNPTPECFDDDGCDAPDLGSLMRIFNRGTFNLPKVQFGRRHNRDTCEVTAKPESAASSICYRDGWQSDPTVTERGKLR